MFLVNQDFPLVSRACATCSHRWVSLLKRIPLLAQRPCDSQKVTQPPFTSGQIKHGRIDKETKLFSRLLKDTFHSGIFSRNYDKLPCPSKLKVGTILESRLARHPSHSARARKPLKGEKFTRRCYPRSFRVSFSDRWWNRFSLTQVITA